ncbi:ABC transporter permease [Salirhabdus sp. Marseille-P4669]|uniref:ABC transporter permease n=1 Tax=Salirhabdus sp. Marseille-P4669 TaxID=2042310 RepID=UPI000C7DED7D|nr:ABC transporter permease subunit [Salirhabdus sp. Marseille-P4669]
MQWSVIFKKEMLENARNIKWIWVPIVFFIFGIMDPITTYYLPKILESVGGLPEGAVVDIPMPIPAEAFFYSVSEIDSLGLLVIALIGMRLIAGEMKSGVYELVLSKPVKYTNYVTAKWAGFVLLVVTSTFIGLLAGWYYVNLLFGDLGFDAFLTTFLLYSVYSLFFTAIIVFVNTWFKKPGMVLFLSFLLAIGIDIITSIYGHILTWSPGHISSYVNDYLQSGTIPSEMWGTIGTTFVLIIIMLLLSIVILKNKEK